MSPIIMFLDDIIVVFHRLVLFGCSWILHGPESIFIGILLEFSLVVMHPISKIIVVYLVPCLCLFIAIMVLKDSTSYCCYGIYF